MSTEPNPPPASAETPDANALPPQSILDLRAKIDRADEQLMNLISDRIALARAVAIEKQRNNIAIYDAAREEQITARAASRVHGTRVVEAMTYLLTLSRAEMHQVFADAERKERQP
jgi:chorismate mutase